MDVSYLASGYVPASFVFPYSQLTEPAQLIRSPSTNSYPPQLHRYSSVEEDTSAEDPTFPRCIATHLDHGMQEKETVEKRLAGLGWRWSKTLTMRVSDPVGAGEMKKC